MEVVGEVVVPAGDTAMVVAEGTVMVVADGTSGDGVGATEEEGGEDVDAPAVGVGGEATDEVEEDPVVVRLDDADRDCRRG